MGTFMFYSLQKLFEMYAERGHKGMPRKEGLDTMTNSGYIVYHLTRKVTS